VISLQLKAETLSYSCSLFYSFCLSMTHILLPLYALHLNYSPFMIGVFVSMPGVTQLIMRLIGGVLSDRFGERRILWFSYSMMAVGSLILMYSGGLSFIIAALLIMGASRSVYWSASQSYASKIDKSRVSHILGRLTSITSVGQIIGLLCGGLFAGILGYQKSFGVCMLLALIALLLSIMMPDLQTNKSVYKKIADVLAPIPAMFKVRMLYLAGIMAFVGALNSSLLVSFYPVYFLEIGFNETITGALNAIRPVGSFLIGLIFSYILTKLGQRNLFAIGLCGTGVLLTITPLLDVVWTLSLLTLMFGIVMGITNILYQVIVTELSSPEKRAVYLSFVGLFWGLSILIMPFLFGIIVSLLGISSAFVILGGVLVGISLLTPLIYQLLTVKHKREETFSL
jgi:MFS family permease